MKTLKKSLLEIYIYIYTVYSKTIIVYQGYYMTNLAFARQGMDSEQERTSHSGKGEERRISLLFVSPKHTWSPLSAHFTAVHPLTGQPGNQLQRFHPLIIRAAHPGSGPSEHQHTKLILVREKRRVEEEKKE